MPKDGPNTMTDHSSDEWRSEHQRDDQAIRCRVVRSELIERNRIETSDRSELDLIPKDDSEDESDDSTDRDPQ